MRRRELEHIKDGQKMAWLVFQTHRKEHLTPGRAEQHGLPRDTEFRLIKNGGCPGNFTHGIIYRGRKKQADLDYWRLAVEADFIAQMEMGKLASIKAKASASQAVWDLKTHGMPMFDEERRFQEHLEARARAESRFIGFDPEI